MKSLARQRNTMIDNFTQILRRLPKRTKEPSTSSHFGGEMPFKVQVKFHIPLFEGQIYANPLEKLLSLLKGYFSVQNFSNNEKITFTLLKAIPQRLVGELLIQVDISVYPPFPTSSKQFSGNFGNFLFLAVFNFRGHFEGLNEGFFGSRFSIIVKGFY
jgi:hypothetical protein